MKLPGKVHKYWWVQWLVSLLMIAALPSAVPADYIRIKGTVVNVRQGPGTSHPVLFQAEEGEEFDLVSTEGLWCLVKLQTGQEAWVFRKLVVIVEGDRPGMDTADESAREPEGSKGVSWVTKLLFTFTVLVLTLGGLWKRKQIRHFSGMKLREISGYKREQAFRYDNRKPSDDSWEL